MGFFTDLIINTFISDKTKKTLMLSEQTKMNKLLKEQNDLLKRQQKGKKKR
jgi:hypothetical protein